MSILSKKNLGLGLGEKYVIKLKNSIQISGHCKEERDQLAYIPEDLGLAIYRIKLI